MRKEALREETMELSEIFEITSRQVGTLSRAHIHTVKELLDCRPRHYFDLDRITLLAEAPEGQTCGIAGILKSIRNHATRGGRLMTAAELREEGSGNILKVLWIEQPYRVRQYVTYIGARIIACGKVSYDPAYRTYSMFAPSVFKEAEQHNGIFVGYKDIKGISDENISKCVRAALEADEVADPLPEALRCRYRLLSRRDAYRCIHFPDTMDEVTLARKRFVFDDLLYLSLQLEDAERAMSRGSGFAVRTLSKTRDMEASLPYALTEGKGQKDVLEALLGDMQNGRRVDAVIQGDVGCGKTIVAFLLLMAAAENGGQGVMMASTTVLAQQHFAEMKEWASKYGFHAAILAGTMKASEKKKILAGLADGSIDILIGTHGVFSTNVAFKNLALVIMDEEHKYGVKQREALIAKGGTGVHVVSMSATPIPRSIATVIYNGQRKLYSIEKMPAGRLPVKTAIYSGMPSIMRFLRREIEAGRQAYVVCPLVDKNEQKLEGVFSVEDTLRIYESYFLPYGINAAALTARTKKAEAEAILEEFQANRIQILISTTVVEVGVNVPNASVIVINSADRFGLASLHQLRGRVGRGKYQSYCILNSEDTENERLKVIASTTSGFDIAEQDMKLRGAGNMVGVEQTGRDRFMEEAMQYPAMFAKVRQIAVGMFTDGTAQAYLTAVEAEREEAAAAAEKKKGKGRGRTAPAAEAQKGGNS